MNDPTDPTDAFLRESEWVHRLALRLVADPGTAGDAAQETLTLALGRGESERMAPRSWLAGALRHVVQRARRGEARRTRREMRWAAERSELTCDDDVATGLERLELQRRVLELVHALDDPYRATLVLRFVEERTPAEIAQMIGVPLKTVYSRLERALAHIRARLDQHHGGRKAWALALIPTGRPDRAIHVDSEANRHMLHLTQALVVTAALTAPLLWFTRDPAGPEPHTGHAAALAELETRDTDVVFSGPTALRRAIETRPEPTAVVSATLDVQVVDAGSGEPLPAIGLVLVPFSRANPFLHSERAVTDATGRARFVGLTPGRCTVADSLGGGEMLELAPGEVRELVLRGSSVWHVSGKVVDRDGRAVEGAEVWVTAPVNRTDGWLLARTSAAGKFAVPVVDGAWVGARMRGHVRSLLQRVAVGMAPPELALRQRARTVRGTVVDTAGRPIAGATVCYGLTDPQLVQGSRETMTPPGLVTRSDTSGSFVFEECERRRDTLHVRAPGYAYETIADVTSGDAASTDELEVVLSLAAIVEGRATDAQGAPLAGVQIAYGRYADLGSGLVWTDADGCFRLDSAPLGAIELSAHLRDVGSARATVEGRPGETVRWDPVIPREAAITGLVVDERGAPRAGLVVEAISPVGHVREPRAAYADSEGRFRIIDLVDLPYRIEIKTMDLGQVEHVVDGIRVGEAPLRLEVGDAMLPSAVVSGTFHAPSGVELRLIVPGSSRLHEPRFDGARFESGPWVAGRAIRGARVGPPQAVTLPRAPELGPVVLEL